MRRIALALLVLAALPGCGTLTATRYYVNGTKIKTDYAYQHNKHNGREIVNSYRWHPRIGY